MKMIRIREYFLYFVLILAALAVLYFGIVFVGYFGVSPL